MEKQSYCNHTSAVVLKCVAMGDHLQLEFHSWTHLLNGVVIRLLNGTNRNNISELEIQPCGYQDQGHYVCSAENKEKRKILTGNTTTEMMIMRVQLRGNN